MKIELEEPFKSKWKYGNVTVLGGRRMVTLQGYDHVENRILSYARYLYSIHLGYEVPPEFEVDHINDDKLDDRVSNYQLLTSYQNKLKQHQRVLEEQQCYGYFCANCGINFILTERQVKMRLSQKVEHPFCSRVCASTFTVVRQSKDEETIKEIQRLKREEKMSSYKIAEILGISRNTVMKYW